MKKMLLLPDILAFLKQEVDNRNTLNELSLEKPDPLMVASRYKDEHIALICALFSYGKASLIVNFLNSLDFSLLNANDLVLKQSFENHYYRFQTSRDVQEIFLTCKRAKDKKDTLESVFLRGYNKNHDVMAGLCELITFLYDLNSYRSRGYEFLLGKIPHAKSTSPYKRFHMFLRWMVRDDNLDLGLWRGVNKRDLLVPLDTHTFKIGKKIGFIQRDSYDFKAVLELTESLRKLDKEDPVKYDFALYRLGQEKILD